MFSISGGKIAQSLTSDNISTNKSFSSEEKSKKFAIEKHGKNDKNVGFLRNKRRKKTENFGASEEMEINEEIEEKEDNLEIKQSSTKQKKQKTQEQIEKTKLRNRISAQKSRDRKKEEFNNLTQENSRLTEELSELNVKYENLKIKYEELENRCELYRQEINELKMSSGGYICHGLNNLQSSDNINTLENNEYFDANGPSFPLNSNNNINNSFQIIEAESEISSEILNPNTSIFGNFSPLKLTLGVCFFGIFLTLCLMNSSQKWENTANFVDNKSDNQLIRKLASEKFMPEIKYQNYEKTYESSYEIDDENNENDSYPQSIAMKKSTALMKLNENYEDIKGEFPNLMCQCLVNLTELNQHPIINATSHKFLSPAPIKHRLVSSNYPFKNSQKSIDFDYKSFNENSMENSILVEVSFNTNLDSISLKVENVPILQLKKKNYLIFSFEGLNNYLDNYKGSRKNTGIEEVMRNFKMVYNCKFV